MAISTKSLLVGRQDTELDWRFMLFDMAPGSARGNK